MRRNLIGATLIALLLTISNQANAQEVLFDFRSTGGNGVAGGNVANTNFDPGNAGDVITLEAGITVTIVDITAPEYDVSAVETGGLPVQTGNTLSAAAGDPVIACISGQNALGIDNPSISNGENDLIGDGNDSADMNPGETITLTFDQAVVFTAIELESVRATDSFDVLVNGSALLETTGDDAFLDSLGVLQVLRSRPVLKLHSLLMVYWRQEQMPLVFELNHLRSSIRLGRKWRSISAPLTVMDWPEPVNLQTLTRVGQAIPLFQLMDLS